MSKRAFVVYVISFLICGCFFVVGFARLFGKDGFLIQCAGWIGAAAIFVQNYFMFKIGEDISEREHIESRAYKKGYWAGYQDAAKELRNNESESDEK